MIPRPPFVPAWIPEWALIANTLLVEVLLLAAIAWFVVRRAERRRRALAVFAALVLALTLSEALAAVELGTEPVRRARIFVHDRVPADATHPRKFARLYFSWLETPILHRESERSIVADESPSAGAIWVDMSVHDGLEVRFPEGGVLEGAVPDELWAFHRRAPDAANAQALWETLRGSTLARTNDRLGRFVGR